MRKAAKKKRKMPTEWEAAHSRISRNVRRGWCLVRYRRDCKFSSYGIFMILVRRQLSLVEELEEWKLPQLGSSVKTPRSSVQERKMLDIALRFRPCTWKELELASGSVAIGTSRNVRRHETLCP